MAKVDWDKVAHSNERVLQLAYTVKDAVKITGMSRTRLTGPQPSVPGSEPSVTGQEPAIFANIASKTAFFRQSPPPFPPPETAFLTRLAEFTSPAGRCAGWWRAPRASGCGKRCAGVRVQTLRPQQPLCFAGVS